MGYDVGDSYEPAQLDAHQGLEAGKLWFTRYKFKIQLKSCNDAEFAPHYIHIDYRVRLWRRQPTKILGSLCGHVAVWDGLF
uniref:Uncharacterized protein n=1 Tax=Arundo donax TaxID=35708 RepID=A0A0A9B387_ARUDO